MSKQLLLMRHAKADRDASRWEDFDRPLNPRGLRDAPTMGRWLAKQGCRLDHILSSSSVRTVETAKLVAEPVGYKGSIETEDSLYEGSGSEYLAQIRLSPQSIESLLVVGHNPALEQLVEELSGEWVTLKTSAVAVLRYRDSDWSRIGAKLVQLVDVWSPKTINGL
jgi:phosphohistidine phosphatase